MRFLCGVFSLEGSDWFVLRCVSVHGSDGGRSVGCVSLSFDWPANGESYGFFSMCAFAGTRQRFLDFLFFFSLTNLLTTSTHKINKYKDLFLIIFYQNSSLLFFVSTTTHKRALCQRISFFQQFITLIDFFEKRFKMATMAIRRKGSKFSKPSTVYDIITTYVA